MNLYTRKEKDRKYRAKNEGCSVLSRTIFGANVIGDLTLDSRDALSLPLVPKKIDRLP
jgi:hypothetical protein